MSETVNYSTIKLNGECQYLWDDWFELKSIDKRNRLFEYYLPWCRRVVSTHYRKYSHPTIDWNDFVSAASIEILHAIELYDIKKNVPFEAFAYIRIKGAILKSIRSSTKDQKLKEYAFKTAAPYVTTNPQGDTDSLDVVIEATVDIAIAVLIEHGMIDEHALSTTPHGAYEQNCIQKDILQLVEQLPKNQAFVVKCYYYQQLSFTEISNILHVSKARISQLHTAAIHRIKDLFRQKT